MELVKGVPITAYCDAHRLTPRQRLELFIPVCEAIQHAHQKGIIHRDVKSSNVLVARYDDKPVPKVIDFGVAKAVGSADGLNRLTERTLHTGYGAVVGTVEYMSPEQASFNQLDVDTRSDIYSLGVLLYELLTGGPPFGRAEVETVGLLETLRLIREQDPPRPSTRLSTADGLPALATNRGTEPKRLAALVRGELDWIVMKALEKDRNRRYATAHDLAQDVRRYLAHEPVAAGPPGRGYRVRKFVRRNRGPVLAAAMLLLTLVGGVVGTTWGLVRAEKAWGEEAEQRSLAEKNEQIALNAAAAESKATRAAAAAAGRAQAIIHFFEDRILSAARPKGKDEGLGPDVSLREAVEAAIPFVSEQFRNEPFVDAHLRMSLGGTLSSLGEYAKAAEQFEKAYEFYVKRLGPDGEATLNSANTLATCYHGLGRPAEAIKLHEDTLARRKAIFGIDHAGTLSSMANLAIIYREVGWRQEALQLHEEALARRKVVLGADHPDTLNSMNDLAVCYRVAGRPQDALKLHEETLARRKAVLAPNHPDTLTSMQNLANGYADFDRHQEALVLREQLLTLRKKLIGRDHPFTLNTMHNLANSYAHFDRHEEALKLRQETLALRKAKQGADHPETLSAMNNLARSYLALDRKEEALAVDMEALALRKARFGVDDLPTLNSMCNVAVSLVDLGRGAEAVVMIDECLRLAAGKQVEPTFVPRLMRLRHRHFAKTRDATGCRATAEMWEQLGRTDAESLFQAARFRAITATAVRQDPRTPDANAARLTQEEIDRAMDWFRKAVAKGYKNVQRLKTDNDLAPIRNHVDFKKAVAALEAGKK